MEREEFLQDIWPAVSLAKSLMLIGRLCLLCKNNLFLFVKYANENFRIQNLVKLSSG